MDDNPVSGINTMHNNRDSQVVLYKTQYVFLQAQEITIYINLIQIFTGNWY